MADKLAVAGAQMHQVSVEVANAAARRQADAVTVQRMMLSILKARFDAETCCADCIDVFDCASDVGHLGIENGNPCAAFSYTEDQPCIVCTVDLSDELDTGSGTLSGGH